MNARSAWSTLFVVFGAAGFGCFQPREVIETAIIDQDVNDSESDAADRAIPILLGMDNVQMVMLRRNDRYEVRSRGGTVTFERRPSSEGWVYEVVGLEGTNPLALQDPKALPDLASELAAGSNPMGTDYKRLDPGYAGPADPRMAFFEPEKVSFPLPYERIAAMFDGEHVGDLVVEFTPWGWFPLGKHEGLDNPGAHGQLNVVSSRAPLVIAGKGAKKGQSVDGWARSVDIAPTVAKAMGVKKTFGVDEHGRYTHDNYLKWQDGHPLDEALDGETPSRVVIIVNDALTNSELLEQLSGDGGLETYRWMVENGTMYRYGAITNFPSNTFASHNTIGTGAYSGHHGLIDNWFYDREDKKRHDPLTEIFDTGRFVSDEVETLHEAVHRSFPNWDPETSPLGNYTMSINTPSTKGADHAMIEGVRPIDWDRCPEPEGLALPELDLSISQRAQGADNLGLSIFAKAVLGRHKDADVRCAQPPRYTIINFGLTDDVTHETGPHSDALRRAIVQTDQRQRALFDTLKQVGWFEDTMFILTSDHGQCLQDTSRLGDFKPALAAAGIKFVATNAYIYLLTLDVELSTRTFPVGQQTHVEITVTDDDDGAPIAGAEVVFESGAARATAVTDAGGRASVDITPETAETKVTVSDADHTRYEKTFR